MSICRPSSSEVFDPRRAIEHGSRRHLIRRPHALRYLCDDQHRRRGSIHGLVGLRPRTARTCRLGRRSSPREALRRHCGVVTRSPASRRSSPATALSRRINRPGMGTTGILVTTGPISLFKRSGASLEVSVPFSTRRPRRALSPKAAGLRTCPAPAFGARFSPALACHGPDDQRTRRPCGFPLYQRGHCGVARSGGRFRAESCGPASCSRVARDALHDEQNRADSISHRLRSVARVWSVKPTRLMIFPHARGGPADRAALCPTPPRDLAARLGHAPTRPLRAAFRYPHPGAVARPCQTSGPSLLLASSGGAPGVRSLRRFNPVYGWSRGASTAAKSSH